MSPKSQQLLIYVLLGVILLMFGYIVMTRDSGSSARISERDLRRLEERLAEKRGGPDADPYEKNEVKNTLLKGAAEPIQVCYKAWFAKNPSFVFGKIAVDWTISPSGEPDKVEIISSELPDINACVVESIRKLKFPPPPLGESRYIKHKFLFRREEPEQNAKILAPAPKK